MNDLNLFQYEGQRVRTVAIDGDPWFVASDVSRILQYRMASDMTRIMDDDTKGTQTVRTSGGEQVVAVISEGGLYDVILRREAGYIKDTDNRSKVKAFQRWITHEVLPSIRKTGSFGTPTPAPELTPSQLMAKALIVADATLKATSLELEAAQPAVEYTQRYVSNDDAVTVSSYAAQYGMTGQSMFALLKENGIVYRPKVGEHFSEKRDRIVEDYEHRAYADYLRLFDLRPQHGAPRYHNGQVRQTLYIRQAHALELAVILGLGKPMTSLELAS